MYEGFDLYFRRGCGQKLSLRLPACNMLDREYASKKY
jgi:hypothetical protein